MNLAGKIIRNLSYSLGLCTFLLSYTVQAKTECSHLIGSCEYYNCIEESKISCGESGYLIGFGGYYCQKFTDKDFSEWKVGLRRQLFPVDGNAWRDEVRSCLQEEMEEFFASKEQANCQEIKDFAFASHPACYTGTNSFCSMTPENILAVGLTLELDELRDPAVRLQMKQTAEICVGQLEERIQSTQDSWLRFELGNVQNLWRAVAEDPIGILDWGLSGGGR